MLGPGLGVGEAATPLLSGQWRHTRQQPVLRPLLLGKLGPDLTQTSIAKTSPASPPTPPLLGEGGWGWGPG